MHGQAADRALADAGLTFADVDGFATTGFFPMYATGVAEYLGLHPIYFDETNSGGSSFEVLVEHAAYAVEAGAVDVVLVTYGSVQLSQMGRRLGTGGGGGGFAPGPAIYDALWGNTLVGNYAMAARRHMHEFGTTPEQLAAVAVSMRRHAATNPQAQEREPITVDDVVSSRLVADPLHKLDCCVISDGGGACVVTTEERAADLPRDPIYILGRRARHHASPQPVGHAEPDRHPRRPVRAGGLRPGRDHPGRRRRGPALRLVHHHRGAHRGGPRVLRQGRRWCVRRGRRPRGGRPAPDQHRRRGPLGVSPRHAGHVPHRRGGATATGRRAVPPRFPTPASPWRTGPAACCRPAPPSSWDGRRHDRSTHRPRATSVPPSPGPHRPRTPTPRRTGPRRTRGASWSNGAPGAAPDSSIPATAASCAGGRWSGSRRAGGARCTASR